MIMSDVIHSLGLIVVKKRIEEGQVRGMHARHAMGGQGAEEWGLGLVGGGEVLAAGWRL